MNFDVLNPFRLVLWFTKIDKINGNITSKLLENKLETLFQNKFKLLKTKAKQNKFNIRHAAVVTIKYNNI